MNTPVTPSPDQKADALFALYEAAFEVWNSRVEREAKEQRRAAWNQLPSGVKAALAREFGIIEEEHERKVSA